MSWSDEVIAVVDGEPIVRSFVESVSYVFSLKDEKESLDFVIQNLVVLKYAESVKYTITDDEVDTIIKRISGGEIKRFELELARMGMTIDEYRNFVRAKRISDAIFLELTGGGFVSDEELLKFYSEHETEISKLFERRYILYREFDLDRSENFPGKVSPDLSEFSEIGWVRRGELRKDFDDVIFSLPSTGFTHPVFSDEHKIVFFIADIKRPNFSELRNNTDFRDYYISIKYKEVFERWINEKKRDMDIRILR